MDNDGKKIDFLIKQIDFDIAEGQAKDWKIFFLFNGMIGSFEYFSSHISILKPNILPHPINSHEEEELIIPIRGNLEIITSDFPTNQTHNSLILEPGSFVYHSPCHYHSLRCNGSNAAQYLVIKVATSVQQFS